MSKPLSERIKELTLHPDRLGGAMGTYIPMPPVEVAWVLEEAAALARRVEGAAVVEFWSGDHDGSYEVKTPEEADAIQTGQRVALVPVEGGADVH